MARTRDKCSAGALINTLDTGLRIVEQAKLRRPDLPPDGKLYQLEESLNEGKKELEDALAKGTRRFGPNFGQGDLEAQLALSQIIIEIQDTLLERLANPREDEILECIDVTERGWNDALIEMRHQHKRQLEQEMGKVHKRLEKAETRSERSSMSQMSVGSQVSQEPLQPDLEVEVESFPAKNSVVMTVQQPNTPRTKKEGSRWMSFGRSKSIAVPSQPQNLSSSPPPAASHQWSGTRHASLAESKISPQASGDSLPLIAEANYMPLLVHRNTQSSTTSVPARLPSPTSRDEQTVCKYTHFLLEDKVEKGLEKANPSLYSQSWIWQCKSTKCSFKGIAAKNRKGHIVVDDRILQSNGAEYRWLLLAKSHCRHEGTDEVQPYKCLVCVQLGDASSTFIGADALIEHMVTHAEAQVGVVKFQGPLRFVRDSFIPSNDKFDIIVPKLPPKQQDKRFFPTQAPVIRQQNPMIVPLRPAAQAASPPTATIQHQRPPHETLPELPFASAPATTASPPAPTFSGVQDIEQPVQSPNVETTPNTPTFNSRNVSEPIDIVPTKRTMTIDSKHSSLSYELDPAANPWQD